MFRILVVCTGNICRSPMAEGLLRHRVAEAGLEGRIEIRSAGTWASPGGAASEHGVTVSAEAGIDIEEHRSQPLSHALLTGSDLILVMTPEHSEFILDMAPDLADRVHLLTKFSDPELGSPHGVADPIGGTITDYRETFEQLMDLVDASMPKVRELAGVDGSPGDPAGTGA